MVVVVVTIIGMENDEVGVMTTLRQNKKKIGHSAYYQQQQQPQPQPQPNTAPFIMKLSPLSVVAVFAVFASFAASAEDMFGLDDESSSEQGQRGLTCSKPRCKPERVCKEDIPYQCPMGKKLDFNDDCFFDGGKGPYISKLPALGVDITVKKKRYWDDNNWELVSGNVARLLHSGDEHCDHADPDLMTPSNLFCTTGVLGETLPLPSSAGGCTPGSSKGLGVGNGGSSNNEYLGNILIVEEHGVCCGTNCDCPDDAGIGGQMVFNFFTPMTVDYLEIVDIDDPVPQIKFYYEGGGYKIMYGEDVDNNGVWRKHLVEEDPHYPLQENVIKIRIRFKSSGGVSAIHYHCPEAHSNGDPHFTTWSGEHFDFQGECDLVLVDNPTFKTDVGMHIHGRTKLHGSWSAFSSVAVKMGEDVLEVHGSAAPFINGVELQVAPMEYGAEFLLPIKLSGFDVSVQNTGPNSRKYIIHLGNGERIFINNFKEFVDLDIENVQSSEFMGSSGLLGNFNAGTKLGRDGKTVIEDEDVLGQEWQVTDTDPQLFTLVDGPQYPAKCNMPEKLSAAQRHLRAMTKKVSEDDAKSACANAKPDRMQNCIADVFGSDNIDMAGIYTVHSF